VPALNPEGQKMNAQTRLLADEKYDSDYVNNDKNFNWQREMNEKYHGKPRTPGRVLPDGTFTKSASEIAHILKQHSEDFQQAMSKLTSFINRSGRNLQGADKERLYSAKDALRNAYGVQDDSSSSTETTSNSVLMNNGNSTVGFDESQTGKDWLEGSSEIPIHNLPQGHNLDDGYLNTGIDESPEDNPVVPMQDPMFEAAALRLLNTKNLARVRDPDA
jgi:hypothetical protein